MGCRQKCCCRLRLQSLVVMASREVELKLMEVEVVAREEVEVRLVLPQTVGAVRRSSQVHGLVRIRRRRRWRWHGRRQIWWRSSGLRARYHVPR